MLELIWGAVIVTLLVLGVTLFFRSLRLSDKRRRDQDRIVHTLFDEDKK